MGHVLLAPSTAGEYDTYTNYPLFYAPDEKVDVYKRQPISSTSPWG